MKNESLKNKSIPGKRGGKRPGAGRKMGGMNKKTRELRIVEEEIKQRVIAGVDNLLNAQFNLANGCSFLYVIRTETGPKGGKIRQKPIAASVITTT